MPDIQSSLDAIQEEFDADLERGYRGARVDPEPNSAYSQETDPTTSPRALRYRQFEIDEFADPDNPNIENIHGRQGIVEGSDEDDSNNTDTLVIDIAAHATAGTGQTTESEDEPAFDGLVSGATFTPDVTITGSGTNYRTFALKNHSKSDAVVATIDTQSTRTGGAAVNMTLGSADLRDVSAGDELVVVETTTGTGVAHAGAAVTVTVTR